MEPLSETVPSFKVSQALKDDFERVLRLANYRRPDYLRLMLADRVRADLQRLEAEKAEASNG